jgi:lipoic acid synthetase
MAATSGERKLLRVASSVQTMGLRYATITGVARDDLTDGGACLYAETVRAIHELNHETGVENLVPDFNGKPDLLREVFESGPEVLAHNVETMPRIFKRIPVERWVKPEEFVELRTEAEQIGFSGVMSGPLVRSSYRAGRLYRQAIERRAA